MILEEATFEAFGYEVWELRPKSHKPILSACERCGKIRVAPNHAYRCFCNSCSVILGEKKKGKKHPMYDKHHSEEAKALMSMNHADQTGEKSPRFGTHHTEETRAKISDAEKGEMNHNYGMHRSEEHKAKISAGRKGKYMAEKSPRWLGGISFDPYCIKFNNEYKNHIRELFDRECFLCGMSETDNGQALSVHHVNYNKNCGCDGTVCMCVPLCRACHAKTGADRDYWQRFITNKLKNTLCGW